MVNSIMTVCGKVNEHLCPFAANAAGFQKRMTNQEVTWENL